MKRITLCIMVLAGALLAAQAAAPRPNVVLIIVDDLGWRDLSCYGSTFHQTVNMDRLSREGVRFTQAYAAHPRCARARFGILSGKYPARVNGDLISFPDAEVSFGEAFRDAGYSTFYCGKWILGTNASAPEQHGFSKAVAVSNSAGPRSHFAPYNQARIQSAANRASISGLDDVPKDKYLADHLADETIKFIRENRERPFLAVLSHYSLAPPLEAKRDYEMRYRRKLQENPPETGAAWESDGAAKNKLKQDNTAYAGVLHSVDEGIGRILDMLRELKLAENTVVILCSDNGGISCKASEGDAFTSNRPLRAGKGHLYEGGIRVPLLIKWPGVTKGGSACDLPVIAVDLCPTLLEIAGISAKPRQKLDGRSLVGFLKSPAGSKADSSRALFWHSPLPQPSLMGDTFCSAVRCGKYKLIDFYAEGRLELYDLSTDLEERHNLAGKLGSEAAELKAKLDGWRKELGASMPTRMGSGKASSATLKVNKAKTNKNKKGH